MDYYLGFNTIGQLSMSFSIGNSLRSNFLLSLNIKKGSWYHNPNFGSRLHEIKTLTDYDVNLAKTFSQESLQWMLDIKKISNLNIETFVVANPVSNVKCLKINMSALDNNLQNINFETYYRVV